MREASTWTTPGATTAPSSEVVTDHTPIPPNTSAITQNSERDPALQAVFVMRPSDARVSNHMACYLALTR